MSYRKILLSFAITMGIIWIYQLATFSSKTLIKAIIIDYISEQQIFEITYVDHFYENTPFLVIRDDHLITSFEEQAAIISLDTLQTVIITERFLIDDHWSQFLNYFHNQLITNQSFYLYFTNIAPEILLLAPNFKNLALTSSTISNFPLVTFNYFHKDFLISNFTGIYPLLGYQEKIELIGFSAFKNDDRLTSYLFEHFLILSIYNPVNKTILKLDQAEFSLVNPVLQTRLNHHLQLITLTLSTEINYYQSSLTKQVDDDLIEPSIKNYLVDQLWLLIDQLKADQIDLFNLSYRHQISDLDYQDYQFEINIIINKKPKT